MRAHSRAFASSTVLNKSRFRNKRRGVDASGGTIPQFVRIERCSTTTRRGGGRRRHEERLRHHPLRIPIDATGTPLGAKPGPEKPPIKEPRQRHIPRVTAAWASSSRPPGQRPRPNAPPFDDLRNYAYEGCGSTAGSLSPPGLDRRRGQRPNFDYLNGWGPRFPEAGRHVRRGQRGGGLKGNSSLWSLPTTSFRKKKIFEDGVSKYIPLITCVSLS
ncbi:hypothetical protein CEXT_489531 [Caerostris extrusa]|uniref:Cadherin Y-type LIR-motif domain-containing protein n=1 Tax=Caerostris extrusa TaxID=172846 RepID=A0AAV4TAK2_CAEEX|nr:hypothetical protein CEXT_489531 [Caerostris extrusa]